MGDKNHALKLSDTQKKILTELRNNPNMIKPQLPLAIGVGKTTIDKGITYLKKYGLIERVGSNRYGYWKVK